MPVMMFRQMYPLGSARRVIALDDADHYAGIVLVAAVYAQDQVELSREWQAIVGLRFDSFDLEYHNIDPAQSLFYGTTPRRMIKEVELMLAQTDPPKDTRAHGRGKLVEMVTKRKGSPIYAFDWNFAKVDRQRVVDLSDPFDTYANPWDQWGNPIFEP